MKNKNSFRASEKRNASGSVLREKELAIAEIREMLKEPAEEEAESEWCPHCDRPYHDESECPACASFYDTLG